MSSNIYNDLIINIWFVFLAITSQVIIAIITLHTLYNSQVLNQLAPRVSGVNTS
jgi:hypothetical protein